MIPASWIRRFAATSPTPPGTSSNRVSILGRDISYLEAGNGSMPVVFVQLGIGSSFMWRRVLTSASARNRYLAVDLLGTGESERANPDERDPYTVLNHRQLLEAFVDAMVPDQPVVLVVHGIGSIVGFSWAAKNPGRVRGVVHMESIIRSLHSSDLPEDFLGCVLQAREPGGESYSVESGRFVTDLLPTLTLEPLRAHVRASYERQNNRTESDRRAAHSAFRSLPIDGAPVGSVVLAAAYEQWLRETEIPKLLISGSEALLQSGSNEKAARDLPNQTVVQVRGKHLLTEDSPDGVSTFLRAFLDSLA